MMTSSLANKSIILKIGILKKLVNEIINPPCKSRLATLFELKFEACQTRVSICFRTLVCLKRTLRQFLELLFPLPLLMSPNGKFMEREARRVLWGVREGPIELGGVFETEAATEAEVEDEDEDVYVVGGVDEVGLSGYESEGFTLSVFLRRKRLAEKNLSEGVIDTTQLPQNEFLYLQHLPVAFLLDFLCSPVTEFY